MGKIDIKKIKKSRLLSLKSEKEYLLNELVKLIFNPNIDNDQKGVEFTNKQNILVNRIQIIDKKLKNNE